MSDWDGRGLPPVAAERVRRAAEGGAWTSLLSPPAAAGLEVAGFDPVGEVMGSMVQRIGWSSFYGCGATGLYGATSRTITSRRQPTGGLRSLRARPGHRLGHRDRPDDHRGDHDRSRRHRRSSACPRTAWATPCTSSRPWAQRSAPRLGHPPRAGVDCICPGQDVAKLVLAGWVPVELALGIAVGIRHDDWATRQQRTWTAGNIEVAAHTELVNQTRADARMLLRRRIAAVGADGAIISSMRLRPGRSSPRKATPTTSPRPPSSPRRSAGSTARKWHRAAL